MTANAPTAIGGTIPDSKKPQIAAYATDMAKLYAYIERFDAGLHWDNITGQYSHGSTLGFQHNQRLRQGNRG